MPLSISRGNGNDTPDSHRSVLDSDQLAHQP